MQHKRLRQKRKEKKRLVTEDYEKGKGTDERRAHKWTLDIPMFYLLGCVVDPWVSLHYTMIRITSMHGLIMRLWHETRIMGNPIMCTGIHLKEKGHIVAIWSGKPD